MGEEQEIEEYNRRVRSKQNMSVALDQLYMELADVTSAPHSDETHKRRVDELENISLGGNDVALYEALMNCIHVGNGYADRLKCTTHLGESIAIPMWIIKALAGRERDFLRGKLDGRERLPSQVNEWRKAMMYLDRFTAYRKAIELKEIEDLQCQSEEHHKKTDDARKVANDLTEISPAVGESSFTKIDEAIFKGISENPNLYKKMEYVYLIERGRQIVPVKEDEELD